MYSLQNLLNPALPEEESPPPNPKLEGLLTAAQEALQPLLQRTPVARMLLSPMLSYIRGSVDDRAIEQWSQIALQEIKTQGPTYQRIVQFLEAMSVSAAQIRD